MITMDFEGINWIGNVYQKFEAMCLEMEEVIYQDTVKYVENQVQTIGTSVKRFYSDVIQDLLPPSSVNHVNVHASDLSLYPYGDIGIYKNPKESIKKDILKTNNQVTVDRTVIDCDIDYRSTLGGFHDIEQPASSVGLVEGVGLELFLERNDNRRSYVHSNGLIRRRCRRNIHLPSDMSRPNTLFSESLSRASSWPEISENHEIACDKVSKLSCSGAIKVSECDSSGVKFCNNNVGSTVSIDTRMSDVDLLDENSVEKEINLRCTSVDGGLEMLSAESNGRCADGGVVSPGSCNSNDLHSEEYFSCAGRSADCNLDSIENEDVIIEPGVEAAQQSDHSKMKETCVFVDRQTFCQVSDGACKTRSYKKMIQKAFSSKSLARKQEYKQLAVWHVDMDAGSNQERLESLMLKFSSDVGSKNSSSHSDCESEWELL